MTAAGSATTGPPHCPGFAVPLLEIAVADGLDLARVPALSRQLDQVLALAPRHLVIDLADCPHIDAAAIGLLLEVHRRLWRTDGLLSLRAPSLRLRRILQLARVDRVLHILPDDEQSDPPPARGASAPSSAVRAAS